MAAAIPLAAGVAAAGGSYAMGATALTAMNIGMSVMTIATLLMAPERSYKGAKIPDVTYNATSTIEPLPRVYGTTRLGGVIGWYGNFYSRDTDSNDADKKTY